MDFTGGIPKIIDLKNKLEVSYSKGCSLNIVAFLKIFDLDSERVCVLSFCGISLDVNVFNSENSPCFQENTQY